MHASMLFARSLMVDEPIDPPQSPKRFGLTIVSGTAIACLVMLSISLYPGLFPKLVFAGVFLGIGIGLFVGPIIAVACLVIFIRNRSKIMRFIGSFMDCTFDEIVLACRRLPLRSLALAAILCLVSLSLIAFQVPRRIGFVASLRSWETALATADTVAADRTYSRRGNFNQFIGVYHVDDCLTDERGGVYFRTSQMADGISPDRISSGFCYQPNANGSPFGAAGYSTRKIYGDWHTFSASDDW